MKDYHSMVELQPASKKDTVCAIMVSLIISVLVFAIGYGWVML